MVFICSLCKERLNKLCIACSPFGTSRHTQPAFFLKELKEYKSAHQLLHIITDSFLRVGEVGKLLHNFLARVILDLLFPLVGHLHHPLTCDILDDVLILLLVAIEEHIADCIHRESFGQVFQCEATVTQFLELLNGGTATMTLTQQISKAFGIS